MRIRTNLLNCVRTNQGTYMLTITDGKRRAYRVRAAKAEQAFRELYVPSPKDTRPIEIDLGPYPMVLSWELVIPSQGLTPTEYLEKYGEPYVRDDPTLES